MQPRTPRNGIVPLLLVVAVALVGGGVALAMMGDGEPSKARGVAVHDAWTAPNKDATAVYLTLDNTGRDDRLIGASTSIAATTSLMGTDNGVSHSAEDTEAVRLEVPAGTTELHPGGPHLMLQGLTRELTPGDTFVLRLDFTHAGPLEATVEVVTWDEAADRSS
jgi:hypothetical protein